MDFAAGTFGRWQLALRAPGKQPGLHIFVPDVVAGLHLAIGLAHLREHALLIGDVGFDSIGNQKIGAAARGFRQPCKAAFGLGLESYAESGAVCVRHEHSIAQKQWRARLRVIESPASTKPWEKTTGSRRKPVDVRR